MFFTSEFHIQFRALLMIDFVWSSISLTTWALNAVLNPQLKFSRWFLGYYAGWRHVRAHSRHKTDLQETKAIWKVQKLNGLSHCSKSRVYFPEPSPKEVIIPFSFNTLDSKVHLIKIVKDAVTKWGLSVTKPQNVFRRPCHKKPLKQSEESVRPRPYLPRYEIT